MSTPENTGTDLTRLLHQGQQLLTPVPAGADWLTPIRESGVRGVSEMPLPQRKDEAWRYTPVSFLDQAEYRPLADGPPGVHLHELDSASLV